MTSHATNGHARAPHKPWNFCAIDNLCCLARPGYKTYNAELRGKFTPITVEEEIRNTLGYLKAKKVSTIISLSSSEFAATTATDIARYERKLFPAPPSLKRAVSDYDTSDDPSMDATIENLWMKTFGGQAVVHIRNEDAFRNPTFEMGTGPTLEKFHQFFRIYDTEVSFGTNVAFFCGAGRDRSGAYVVAHLMRKHHFRYEVALKMASREMHYRESNLHRGLLENGGYHALKELQRELFPPAPIQTPCGLDASRLDDLGLSLSGESSPVLAAG
ncbi:MAG: hypothetical protein SP1CHLAM54_02050 [Chlamydiia bacterium]|nr:hypothetical protein [Chlamydiia bacterium]MCH9615123.1 hypothetical protein [Chlamydiia bacterium]MCH9628555.1 hypothetical protein [Chlamydiia bacterium]